MKKKECCNSRLGKVGGQAVLEGVMMRSGDEVAIAVRADDKTIKLETSQKTSIRKKYKILNIPIIRGAVNLVETFIMSLGTLTKSAEMLGIDEDEDMTKFDKWLLKTFGNSIYKIISAISVVFALVFAIGLFSFLPIWVTTWIDGLVAGGIGWFKNLIAGGIKIIIFVGYLWIVSFIPDIKRTYEYHGAEHKSIACYESGMELTPENAAKCKRFHPRCGTSFMFLMLIISILIFSVISWDMNKFAILGLRLLLLPVVVGVGFEIIMIAGKHPNVITNIISAPGLWLQRITTKEPSLDQLEVAITSLKAAMPQEFPGFRDQFVETKETENTVEETVEESNTEETKNDTQDN